MSSIYLSFSLIAGLIVQVHVDKSELEYQAKYAQWRSSVEKDLDLGKSIVLGDEKLASYLGQRAEKHIEFLLTKLRTDQFTVLVFDESNLSKKYESDVREITALQDAQIIWVKILSRILYERKFGEWRAIMDQRSKTGDATASEEGNLMQYLGKHIEEDLAFVKSQLMHDARVVAILEKSSLYQKYRERLPEHGTPQERQRAWVAVLDDLGKKETIGEKRG